MLEGILGPKGCPGRRVDEGWKEDAPMRLRAEGKAARHRWSKNVYWDDEDRRDVMQQRRNGRYLVIIDADELGPWITGINRLKKVTGGGAQRDIVQQIGDASSREWASMCRHGPRNGHLTMSPGLWARPDALITKAASSDRIKQAMQKVKKHGPRNPHFNGLPSDVHYAFLKYSIEGNHTHGKERFQFAVWSNLDPTAEPFQRGKRD